MNSTMVMITRCCAVASGSALRALDDATVLNSRRDEGAHGAGLWSW